jgi:hypothetical protein
MYDVVPSILAVLASCSLFTLLVGGIVGYMIGRQCRPRPSTSRDDFSQQQVSPHDARRWPRLVSSHDPESLN